MRKVLAILCSDIHLSERAPVARSAEPDWYEAMRRPLDELAVLADFHSVPIVCAGDVFDRWGPKPELINFAIEHLPKQMYAVPGQHDLPNHRYEEMHRSAYYTLIEAGVLTNIDYHEPILAGNRLVLHGFPWGRELSPVVADGWLHLAVVHRYIWTAGHTYPGAPEEAKVGKFFQQLTGFTAAVFGDNHQGFVRKLGTPKSFLTVMNCGTLLRRKIDEIGYKPQVGLLYDDGSIEPHYLDTTKDRFAEAQVVREVEDLTPGVQQVIEELKALGADSLDFEDSVTRYLEAEGVDSRVRKFVLEAMGK